MARDDFLETTKKTLAERVGYRCSNPTCGVLTIKASPTSESNTTRIGMAAHITAASMNGPRYDPTSTIEYRKSIDNGIWACQRCGRLIDSDEEAFSVDMLKNWKQTAERRAARDFNSNNDRVAELIEKIDYAHKVITEFIRHWRSTEPYVESFFEEVDFNTRTYALMSHSSARLSAYQNGVVPLVLDIVTSAQIFFGSEDGMIQESKIVLMAAPTNYFTLNDLDNYLQKLKVHLSLY